jgi:hypothetical protein
MIIQLSLAKHLKRRETPILAYDYINIATPYPLTSLYDLLIKPIQELAPNC